MHEIIIPEDGLLYKTIADVPVLQIGHQEDTSFIKLFSADEKSSIVLACHNMESGILISKAERSISIDNKENGNEIRFTNETGNVTQLFYSDNNGGQLDICDNNANSLISMGINPEGSASVFIRNSAGEFLVAIFHNQQSGIIILQDEEGNTIWSSIQD